MTELLQRIEFSIVAKYCFLPHINHLPATPGANFGYNWPEACLPILYNHFPPYYPLVRSRTEHR